MKRKVVHTHALLLEALVSKDLLRTYAYFLKFKSEFSSSRLNKSNRAALARRLKLSERTVRTHINSMIKLGWAVQDGKDLVFIHLKKLYRKMKLPYWQFSRKEKITLVDGEPIRDVITKLASVLLKANLIRQEYILSIKHLKTSFRKPVKRYTAVDNKGLSPKYKKLFETILPLCGRNDVAISCSGIGRLIGMCRTMGFNLKQQMVKLGIITVEPRVQLLRDVKFNYNMFLKMKQRVGENCFYSKGKVYKRLPDRITFVYA